MMAALGPLNAAPSAASHQPLPGHAGQPTQQPTPEPMEAAQSPLTSEMGSEATSETASAAEVEQAVLSVVQVFSKPAPDRERLFKAVLAAVTGEATIKEASGTYGFATSTMHPYVHRARAMLGGRAPQMRSNRIGISSKGGPVPKTHYQFPAHLQNLKAPASPLRMEDVLGPGSGASSPVSQSPRPSPAPTPVAKVEEKLKLSSVEPEEEPEPWPELLDEETSSGGEEKMSAEDAAREAIQAALPDLDPSLHFSLFLGIVRVLKRETSVAEVAAQCSGVGRPSVAAAVERAKELSGWRELTEAEKRAAQRERLVEEAVTRATVCSHYQGQDKQRLYQAVLDAMKGKMPLTQAAATYSVPFSTLHPYMKRAKAQMGLIPASEANALRSPIVLGQDRSASASPATLVPLQSQAPPCPSPLSLNGGTHSPSSGTPTKVNPIRDLPERLRTNGPLMERAVRKAVASCQYDDVGKKDRLCLAVSAALRGEKTMKFAAAIHDVPFTTLQTYFHRAKAQLEKEDQLENMGEITPVSFLPTTVVTPQPPPDSPKAPLSSASGSAFLDALGMTGRKDKDSSEASATWARLLARTSSNDAASEDGGPGSSTASSQASPAIPTGSSRRKPRKVTRHPDHIAVQASEPTPVSFDPPTASPSQSPPVEVPVQPKEEPKVENMELNENFFLASNRHISDMVRGRLAMEEAAAAAAAAAAGVEMVQPTAPDDEAFVYGQPDQPDQPRAANGGGGSAVSSLGHLLRDSDDGYEVSPGDLIRQAAADVQRASGGQVLPAFPLSPEQACTRAIRNSQYDGRDRDRLRDSVLTAIRGERTMKDASKAFAIPLGTFHTYYHRTRNLLSVAQAGLDPDSAPVQALLNHLAQMVGANSGRKKKPIRTKDLSHLSSAQPPSTALAEPASPGPQSTSGPEEEDEFTTGFSSPATEEEIKGVVGKVIKPSQYPGEQKDRLLKSVVSVIGGELTINAAANKFNLPSSTLHPYVHRARKILGDCCPEQAKLCRPNPLPPLGKPAEEEELISPEDLSLEEADKVVSQLVKSSLYNEEGRQRLYEAILMVITEASTVSEASRGYGIPPSTIQPYVMRARTALRLPLVPASHPSRKRPAEEPDKASLASLPIRKQAVVAAPRVYAAPGNEASDDAIQKMVREVVKNSVQAEDRRERLFRAVLAAVSGKATIKDGCVAENLPASTVHPYVSRARHLLGPNCPPPKIATACPAMMGNLKNLYKNRQPYTLVGREDGGDGEEPTVEELEAMEAEEAFPTSPAKEERPSSLAQIFAKTSSPKKEVEMQIYDENADMGEQLREVLDRYNFRGDRDKLQTAIMAVVEEGKGLNEAAKIVAIAPTTLSPYVRIARQFVKDGQIPKTPFSSVKEASSALKGHLSPTKAAAARASAAASVPHPFVLQSPPSSLSSSFTDADAEGLPSADELTAAMLEEGAGRRERQAALLTYLVLTSYRKNDAAKRQLVEALVDVVHHGLKPSVRAATTEGVSENTLVSFSERVRSAWPHVEGFVSAVRRDFLAEEAETEGETKDSPPSAKRPREEGRCGSAASVGSSPTTPTRISRRLQARAEAKAEPIQITTPDVRLASVAFERGFLGQLGSLSEAAFPVTAAFLLRAAKACLVALQPPRDEVAQALDPAWANAYRLRHGFSSRPS